MEKIYRGIVASPGIYIGRIASFRKIDYMSLVPDSCRVQDIAKEIDRLNEVSSKVFEDISRLIDSAPESDRLLIESEKLMLESMISEARHLIESHGVCAEQAVKRIYEKYRDEFSRSGSDLIEARIIDLKDLASRIIEKLMKHTTGEEEIYRDSIVFADEIAPHDFLDMVRRGVKGLVTRRGGVTSHVAILARSYSVPYIILTDEPAADLDRSGEAIIDAVNGVVITDPDRKTLDKYRKIAMETARLLEMFKESSKAEAYTIDNVRVVVQCNMGSLDEVRVMHEYGCDGVGLFRMEFMYVDREKPPSEDEIYGLLTKIAELSQGKEVVIRAPDIGADKPVKFIGPINDPNPQLGVRGIRLLYRYREELLEPFLKAFIRASGRGNLRLMIPMVSTLDEVLDFLDLYRSMLAAYNGSRDESRIPEIGIMVETPSSAVMIDALLDNAPIGFVSIGTNDLTQYMLAADRTNPELQYLYNDLDPSVLRMVRNISRASRSRGVEVKICGEMAGRSRAIPILLSLGITELSVSPAYVGKVKYIVRRLRIGEIRDRIESLVTNASSYRDIEKAIDEVIGSKELLLLD